MARRRSRRSLDGLPLAVDVRPEGASACVKHDGSWYCRPTLTRGADRASTAAYLVEADAALETAEEEGLGFAWYCREVQGAWDRVSDLTCGAAALADLAVLGQDLLEAGSDLDAAWFGRVCGAADVVVRVLEALDAEIPGVLRTVRSVVCGAAESVEPPGGCVPPVVPGCEEVLR